MAKSTTTPFSIEMNLESCPPISKMVSTGSPPRVLLMWMAPVLWAVISSLTASAPTNSAISSRPDPVVPTPRISQPAAPQFLHLGEPLLHGFDGASRGAQVDIVDHRAELVDDHHIGGNRADVQTQVSRDGLAGRRRYIHGNAVAQLHHVGAWKGGGNPGRFLWNRAGSAGGFPGWSACAALRTPAWPCRWRRTRRIRAAPAGLLRPAKRLRAGRR